MRSHKITCVAIGMFVQRRANFPISRIAVKKVNQQQDNILAITRFASSGQQRNLHTPYIGAAGEPIE